MGHTLTPTSGQRVRDTPERCQCRQAVSAGGAQTPGRATEADPVGDMRQGRPKAMLAAGPKSGGKFGLSNRTRLSAQGSSPDGKVGGA